MFSAIINFPFNSLMFSNIALFSMLFDCIFEKSPVPPLFMFDLSVFEIFPEKLLKLLETGV